MPATALRPRSATEIIDAAFQLLRQHYTQLAAIAMVALLPYIAVVAVSGAVSVTSGSGSAFLVLILQWICGAIAEGAVVIGAASAYLDGQTDIQRSLLTAVRRGPAVIVAGVLRGFAAGLAAIAFLFPGIYVLVRTFAIIPVLLLEDRGADESLSRAWKLAKGEGWKIFGTMLLAWLIFMTLYMLLVFAIGVILGLFGTTNERMTSLLVAILLPFVFPITAVVSTLLYYDIRIRREGFDLELMALDAEPVAPSS